LKLYWIVAKRVATKKLEDTSVGEFIPTPVQPLIDAYLHALEPLCSHFCGIYICGSIAFGAFEELESDIDIVALTHEEWTIPELAQLNALHTQLIGTHQLARRLEVLYIPFRDLGKLDREIAPYPTVLHGEFSSAGYGHLNDVIWWTVKHKSIRLLGPERSTLPFEVTWQDVLETMSDNLNGFWVSKARHPHRFLHDAGQSHLNSGMKARKPIKTELLIIARSIGVLRNPLEKLDAIVLLRDDWFEFAVVTHCRILTTIEEGEIITKSVALKRWRERLPARWSTLIDEAWRIRYHLGGPSLYRSRLKRAIEILAFIKYVRKRGGNVLEDLLRKGAVKQCTASSHFWTTSIINWLKTSGSSWRGSSQ
jgi:Aminoglycoside adenylyltransferase, C-terminal domain